MIKLDTLELAPVDDRNERFKAFHSNYAGRVRELSEYAAVEQDVLILSWAWTIGGFAGDEDQWIEYLMGVVSSEYDVHRVRDYKRKKLDREVLLDQLVEHVRREGSGSVEYLITHAPGEYQQILTWKYVAGYTDAEIGDLLGVNQSTITRKLQRCYSKVKSQYTKPIR